MSGKINVLSLFDGMSCGRIALDQLGIECNYFASEVEKQPIQVSQHNYPDTVQLGDVCKVKATDLPKIDLLIGGSPCQGFSRGGEGLNFEDPRSKLFFECVRLLEETSPKYFLLENVCMKEEWVEVINYYLGVKPVKVCSSLVSAQRRPRMYWTNLPAPEFEDRGIKLKDVLQDEGEVDPKFNLSDKGVAYMQREFGGRPRYLTYKNELDGKAGCLLAVGYKGTPYNVIWELKRRLTPLECERLQTVPDGYTSCVSNTARYKMLGNGWTVDVIKEFFRGMKNEL